MGNKSSAGNDQRYVAPAPDTFYIHDDLSDWVRQDQGEDSEAYRLTAELFDLFRRNTPNVVVLTVDQQIELLAPKGDHSPFDATVGIGLAGERVARQLHERTGWFPNVIRIDVTREEDGLGGYNIVSTTSDPLDAQLHRLVRFDSLAVVDDTVFSGLTMRTVLAALPSGLLDKTHSFCLRCVEESLPTIEALCPITAGFCAPGRIFQGVSFINASGLVRPVGIRRKGLPPLAFFERPQWMEVWFPGYASKVMELCRQLNSIVR